MLCGGELGGGERGRDAWKELAYSNVTEMVRGIPSPLHLSTGPLDPGYCACPPFPAPCLRPSPVSFLQIPSRPMSGRPGLPLQPSVTGPHQFPTHRLLFPQINAFSSPPLRPLFFGPGPPSPHPH